VRKFLRNPLLHIFLLALAILFFRNELRLADVCSLFAALGFALCPQRQGQFEGGVLSFFYTSIWTFVLGFFLYFLWYRLNLFVLAQFVLPVTEWRERVNAYKRLLLFARRQHGPAIFVKNGQKVSRKNELDSVKPGVALVDLNSAVVLARRDVAKPESLLFDEELEPVRHSPRRWRLFPKPGRNLPPWEAKGPGVVFTENGQKIEDAVDIRPQSRASEDIEAYTRNGIKVKSRVNVTFSLSDAPQTFLVGYVGGQPPVLKILQTSQEQDELIAGDFFDVEEDDAMEALHAPLEDVTAAPAQEVSSAVHYAFNANRVLNAVLHQARDKNGKFIPWHNAPLDFAVEIFRKMIAGIPYDKFFSEYSLDAADDAQPNLSRAFLASLKKRFEMSVKMKGLVALQFIERLDGAPVFLKPGDKVKLSSLRKRAPVTLTAEKFNFFRHMGIVVKSAGFGEIQAVEEDVQKEMLKNWMAKMESEIAASNAEYELEAIRVRNKNRALVQEEMTHLFSGIFQSAPHFDGADVYNNVVHGFQVPWTSAVYLLAVGMVGLHLYHGVWSMLQTVGAAHPRYNRWRRVLAVVFALLVGCGMAAVPVAVLAGWVRPV
jgi:hypothetical protein